jgi:hypothetical protein
MDELGQAGGNRGTSHEMLILKRLTARQELVIARKGSDSQDQWMPIGAGRDPSGPMAENRGTSEGGKTASLAWGSLGICWRSDCSKNSQSIREALRATRPCVWVCVLCARAMQSIFAPSLWVRRPGQLGGSGLAA